MMSLSLFALASGSASVLSLASPSASDFHTRLALENVGGGLVRFALHLWGRRVPAFLGPPEPFWLRYQSFKALSRERLRTDATFATDGVPGESSVRFSSFK